MPFIQEFLSLQMLTALSAGLAALCAFFAVIELFNDLSKRYKERYIREASTELSDVFSELPPERILNISLVLGVAGALLAGMYVLMTAPASTIDPITNEAVLGWSWPKLLFFSVVSGVLLFSIPRFYLRMKRKQRIAKFNEQLVDALGSMSSALKAGFSINQAIDAVAFEGTKPISDEFKIMVNEMRLGVAIEVAMENLNKRVACEDFDLVAAAVITARQTGGELTVVFDRLANMIRERLRINGRIEALTAQGRMQARIIGAMPYLLLLAMSYVSPEMTQAFYNSALGIITLVAVTILVIIGFLLIRKITTIDI